MGFSRAMMLKPLVSDSMICVRTQVGRSQYTRIPNALFEANLPQAEELAWIRLASLDRAEFSDEYSSMDDLATACHMKRSTLYRAYKALEDKGFVGRSGNTILVQVPGFTPSADAQPVEIVAVEEEPVQETVASEVAKAPRRKPSGISQKESAKQIIEAWNKYKPDAWLTAPPSLNPGTFIAIETQAKRLKIERPGYPGLIKDICLGASQDEWWKVQTMKASMIFGFGSEIADIKFENVEKLYKLGNKPAAKSAGFDRTPKAFLEWYQSLKLGVEEVKSIDTESLDVALETEKRYIEEANGDRTQARVYYVNQKPVHWSGKSSVRALFYLP